MKLNICLKQLFLGALLTLIGGTKLYGVPVGMAYSISPEAGSWEAAYGTPGANAWTMILAGTTNSGAVPMECGYDDPSTGGGTVDLQPDTPYQCTITAGSDICLAGVSFSAPSCYDVWINDTLYGTGWIKTSGWTGGYAQFNTTWNMQGGYNATATAISSPTAPFQVEIEYNTNTFPAAIWCTKGPDGAQVCSFNTLGYFNLPNDGMSAAVTGTTNEWYMGTNYPVSFSLRDNNKVPTGAVLLTSDSGTTVVAGTNCGTVEVTAITADPDPCLATNFFFNITTCGSGQCSLCSQTLYCDNPPPSNGCVDIRFSLGPSKTGKAFLQVQSEVPDPSLGTPQSLQYNFNSPDAYVITNAAGWLRQVLASDRIVDITTNSAFSYLINYYHYANIVGYSPSDGVYYFTNSPYRTVLIAFPTVTPIICRSAIAALPPWPIIIGWALAGL